MNATLKTAALQFDNVRKDMSNVVVHSGKALRLVDVRVLCRDSVVAVVAHFTHHRSAVIKDELRALLEKDTGHMRITCEEDSVVAQLLCAKVEKFAADRPLADLAMEFMSWKEHGCKWTESLKAGVVPGDLRRLFAMVRAASSRGPAKSKLFREGMIGLGEDGYAQRKHPVPRFMQLPPGDRATYCFLHAR